MQKLKITNFILKAELMVQFSISAKAELFDCRSANSSCGNQTAGMTDVLLSRQIMQTVDLDEITSKSIRLQLERELAQRLDDFKAYIDQEILHILGTGERLLKLLDIWQTGYL